MFGLNLATYPDARRACVADRELIPDAIEESLRFNTSAQRFRRFVTTDVEVHGRTMRAGDFVCLAYGSANRDERRWDNPDTYDVARRPTGHLGFGGSVHACLGTAIAKMSTRIMFEELLAAAPDFEQLDATLPWMPSTTFRSPLVLRLGRPPV
jgi:cytochrome P450